MVMTDEQRKALGEKRKQMKINRIKREREKAEFKNTHDWASKMIYSTSVAGGMGGHMAPTHCKRCGMDWLMFKAIPMSCEAQVVKDIIK